MTTTTKPGSFGATGLPHDLMLPADYPFKEAVAIYIRRLGVLITSSTMILGIGIVSMWFSLLLVPILYLASRKVREIARKRMKDFLMSVAVLVLGVLINSILDPGIFGSLLTYALVVGAIVAIFKRH